MKAVGGVFKLAGVCVGFVGFIGFFSLAFGNTQFASVLLFGGLIFMALGSLLYLVGYVMEREGDEKEWRRIERQEAIRQIVIEEMQEERAPVQSSPRQKKAGKS